MPPSRRKSAGLEELLQLIDDAMKREMQALTKDVMSGNFPDKKDLMAKGEFHGLEKARALIASAYKTWVRGDPDEEEGKD